MLLLSSLLPSERHSTPPSVGLIKVHLPNPPHLVCSEDPIVFVFSVHVLISPNMSNILNTLDIWHSSKTKTRTLTFQHCWHLPHLSDMPLKGKKRMSFLTWFHNSYHLHHLIISAIVIQGSHKNYSFHSTLSGWWAMMGMLLFIERVRLCVCVCVCYCYSWSEHVRERVWHHFGWVTQTATGAGGGYVRGLWRTERQSSLVVWLGFSAFEAPCAASRTLSRSSKLPVCEGEINFQL